MSAGTLVLDRGTVSATIASARRALDFLLGAVQSPDAASAAEGRRAAIELHRFADGIATLADDAQVVDFEAARRVHAARARDAEVAR